MDAKISVGDLGHAFPPEANMKAFGLEKYLKTDELKSVSQAENGGKHISSQSSRPVVDILHKKKGGIRPAAEARMHKVHSCTARHSAQRYLLVRQGHDPLKK